MSLLEAIRAAWSWRGLDPTQVIDTSAWGNVIVSTNTGQIWRVCPEELRAEPIAETFASYRVLCSDPQFAEDWNLTALTFEAEALLGKPGDGRCYCLKLPAVLGGRYDGDNLATIALEELIASAGSLAQQIADLPDGAKVSIVVAKPS